MVIARHTGVISPAAIAVLAALTALASSDVSADAGGGESASPNPSENSATATASGCNGTLLYNGICLPATGWPPRVDLDNAQQHPPVLAPWEEDCDEGGKGRVCRPAVIDITIGRQLFVDGFLVDARRSAGWVRRWHQVVLGMEPVLQPDRPWESGCAVAYSGGAWWDPAASEYKMFYSCGCGKGVCLATSKDGVVWAKPALGVLPPPLSKTNMVMATGVTWPADTPEDGNVVWLDLDETNSSRRFKAVQVLHPPREAEGNSPVGAGTSEWRPHGGAPRFANGSFSFLSSRDGLHWSFEFQGAGLIGDRSTAFKDSFRNRWVFSIKGVSDDPDMPFQGAFGRSDRFRLFRETSGDDLFDPAAAQWTPPAQPLPWLVADALDQPWLGDTRASSHPAGRYPGLYNFDAVSFESVQVGLYTIYRCKGGMSGGQQGCWNQSGEPDNTRVEYDSVFLAFSRDGFNFARPPAGEPWPAAGTNLSAAHRVPFAPMSPAGDVSAWNYGDVQSVGGGFVVNDTTMRFYFGAMSRNATRTTAVGTGVFRRDGFASLGAAPTDAEGAAALTASSSSSSPMPVATVTTHVVRWNSPLNLSRLFVNVNGTVAVEVLPPTGDNASAVEPFTAANCVVGGVPPGTPARRVDSTKAEVTWVGARAGLAPLASSHPGGVRLRFTLTGEDTRLYSFWVSGSAAGYSRGFVAAGGPPYSGSADRAL